MRVHIKHRETSVVVPIPQAKTAEWTVADLLAEATRRLAATNSSASKEAQAVGKPTLTSLRIAGSQSELHQDDLVSDVLTNDEQLIALGPEDKTKPHEEKEKAVPAAKAAAECTVLPTPRKTYNRGFGGYASYGQNYGYGDAYGSTCVDDATAPAEEEESSERFVASIRDEEDDEGKEVVVTLVDQQLKNAVNGVTNDELLYEDRPTIEADVLLSYLPLFKNKRNQCNLDTLKPLVAFLEKYQEEASPHLSHMMERKEITFNTLWHLFPLKSKVWGQTTEGYVVGGEIRSTKYSGSFFRGLTITITVLKSTGNGYATREHSFYIPRFEGTIKVEDLPVHRMSDEVEKKLRERGQRFAQLAIGSFHKNYSGRLIVRSGNSTSMVPASGRVMIDGQAFNRFNPNVFDFRDNGHQASRRPTLPQDKLYMTWPTVPGYSFAAKQWGEIAVDNVSDVDYADTAFGRDLILADEKKEAIRSLVKAQGEEIFHDSFNHSLGGCTIVLQGKPGVGKSFTAKAIADLLHRPLYTVKAGELGFKSTELEKRLGEILDLCSSWNAVLLIEAADHLLGKAESRLRQVVLSEAFKDLLESYQGVVFVTTTQPATTNETFDAIVCYPDLEASTRKNIWTHLLEAAGIQEQLDLDKLAAHELNGRQIRATIHQAIALSKHAGVSINDVHFQRAISSLSI